MGDFRQFVEANGGVDVVAQHALAGFHVSCKKTLHSLAKKFSAESGIALHTGADCFFEIPGQSHYFLTSATMVTNVVPYVEGQWTTKPANVAHPPTLTSDNVHFTVYHND